MFKGPLAICEINPSFQKHLLLLIGYYDIKYHYLSSLYINLKTIPAGINFRVKLWELNNTWDNLRAQCTKRSGCGSLSFLCLTTLPLSHFFGWSGGFLCASSENWSSSKSKQLTKRNSKEVFTCVFLFPSCVSTSTHRVLRQSHQLTTFKFYFSWSNFSGKSVFQHS